MNTSIRHHGEPGYPGNQGPSERLQNLEGTEPAARPTEAGEDMKLGFFKRPMVRWLGAVTGALALVVGLFVGVAISDASHLREATELRAQTERMVAQLADAEESASAAETAAADANSRMGGLEEQIAELTKSLKTEKSKTEDAVKAAADARGEADEAVALVDERDARIQELEAQVSVVTAPAPEVYEAPSAPAASYANCSEVRAAGAAPIYEGTPGYGRHLDRDGDGIGCE